MSRLLTLLVALVALSACAEQTNIRASSDYAGILANASTLSALPSMARVVTVDASGNEERMYDYEYGVEDAVTDILVPALRDKGYRVKALSKSEIKDKKLYEAADELHKSFSETTSKAYGPGTFEVEKAFASEMNLGTPAKAFADKSGEDVVVLTQYGETVKTTGARVKDMAIDALLGTNNGAVAESATLRLGVADLKRGKVLWTRAGYTAKTALGSAFESSSDPDAIVRATVKELVGQVLKDLPRKEDLGKPRK